MLDLCGRPKPKGEFKMMNYTAAQAITLECAKAFLKVFFLVTSSLGHSLGPGSEKNIYVLIPPFECAVLCPRKASPIKLLPQKKQFKFVSMEDIASTTN